MLLRRITGCFTLAFLLLLLPTIALADKILIENNTNSPLMELYISNADTNSWEEDVLGSDAIGPGDAVRVDLGRNYMMYDLKAVFGNGSEHVYSNINVRRFKNVRLNGNDCDLW